MNLAATLQPPPETESPVRIWCPFHATLGALIAMTVYLFCGRSVADPDIWWHLKNAQTLVQQHHWIRFDTYSYTVAGTPWTNSEWLSELAYYAAWKAGGPRGLLLLYVCMAELVMLGVLYLAYKASGSIKAAFLSTAFAVLLAVVNFGPRTILFGWACMVLLMVVLWQMMEHGKAPMWVIPILFCFWINLHGSWLIGLVVFGIVFASGLLRGTWGNIEALRWTPDQLRTLTITAIAIIPALFINPYGYKLILYPFDLAFRQKLNVAHVEEWASIDFHEPRGRIVYALLMVLLLLALTARKKWTVPEVAFVAISLYMSLTYVRFLFLAAILLPPVLARRLDFLPPYKREIDKPWLNAAFVVVLSGLMVFRFPSVKVLTDDLVKKFPAGAIHFLQLHPGEHTVNHYQWGGYMIWSSPAVPTFIDSRTDIFEYKGVLRDYLDIVGLKDSLKIIDRYHAQFVLLPSKDPLAYLLRNNSRWRVAYEDDISCVFERTTPLP